MKTPSQTFWNINHEKFVAVISLLACIPGRRPYLYIITFSFRVASTVYCFVFQLFTGNMFGTYLVFCLDR